MSLYAKTIIVNGERVEARDLTAIVTPSQEQTIKDAIDRVCKDLGISVRKVFEPTRIVILPTERGRAPTAEDFKLVFEALDIQQHVEKRKPVSRAPQFRRSSRRSTATAPFRFTR